MTIKDLVSEAHEVAKDHGWWEEPRSPLEIAALIHTEVAEFTEEFRKPSVQEDGGKPVGPLYEIADIVIRCADYCGHQGWDLEKAIREKMDYNRSRSYRHGGKKY